MRGFRRLMRVNGENARKCSVEWRRCACRSQIELRSATKRKELGLINCSLACIKEQASNNYTNPFGCLVRCFRNYELGLGVTKLIEIAETKHS